MSNTAVIQYIALLNCIIKTVNWFVFSEKEEY